MVRKSHHSGREFWLEGTSYAMLRASVALATAIIAVSLQAQTKRNATSSPQVTPEKLLEIQAGADEGDGNAQFQLGRLYLDGQSMPRDRAMAYFWFNLASSRGSKPAAIERNMLENSLTPAQVAQAEALSSEWKPKEALETPALRELFSRRLNYILFDPGAFKTNGTLKTIRTPLGEGELWYTSIRFPGASTVPCSGHSQHLENPNKIVTSMDCIVLERGEADRARAFFERFSDQLWQMPPFRGVSGGWIRDYARMPNGDSISFVASRAVCHLLPSGENYCPVVSVQLSVVNDVSVFVDPRGGCSTCPPPMASDAPVSSPIRAQIEAVERDGRYARLPEAEGESRSSVPPGACTKSIRNQTAYPLTVLFGGPADREEHIAAGSQRDIQLPAGEYKILGRVSATSVLPYFGTQRCDSGKAYLSAFEIH